MKLGVKFGKVGRKRKISRNGGNCIERGKIGRKFRLKTKVVRNFGGLKLKFSSGKGKLGKILDDVRNFFGTRGKSETGGKCIIAPEGMGASDHWSICNGSDVFQGKISSNSNESLKCKKTCTKSEEHTLKSNPRMSFLTTPP